MSPRKNTKQIKIGDVYIGGGAPISVQSMTNSITHDVAATLAQITALAQAGCQIVRLAVPDEKAALALPEIVKNSPLPLIADIHFDYRLALKAVKAGIHGLRLNPGNIGAEDNVRQVVDAVRERKIPIRIGVNSGSLPKDLLQKYGLTAQCVVESVLRHVHLLEKYGYEEIKISAKTSSVPLTIETYRLLSKLSAYPLHLGVTEAGTLFGGTIKSAIGIGTLLAEGIGDTLRVSLTDEPVKEVMVGREILKSLELTGGLNIISCPTCGRTQIDLINLAHQVEAALLPYAAKNITVAVMGCVVNGPGEAREADFGIAGGKKEGLLFKKGEIVAKLDEDKLLAGLLELIKSESE